MFTYYMKLFFQGRVQLGKSRRVNQISFSLSSFARNVHFREGQYQKSYLDLGFRYCISPTQPIFTKTETAMLSTFTGPSAVRILGLNMNCGEYLSFDFPSDFYSLVQTPPEEEAIKRGWIKIS